MAFRLILISLMLAVQSLSFAHELSHHQAPDAEYCSICSGQSGDDVLVRAVHAVSAVPQPQWLADGWLTEGFSQDNWPDRQSRAPPTHP